MIKQKREWRCEKCGATLPKWEGKCRACHAIASMVEFQLTPVKPKEAPAHRALRLRAKRSERDIARTMVQIDGHDPAFERIASSTGRIGHITNIRIDAISKHYVTENKNRLLPKWLIEAWLLIQQRAEDFNKHALLHLDPPNAPRDFVLNGTRHKMSTFCVITQDRHKQLIEKERELEELKEAIEGVR